MASKRKVFGLEKGEGTSVGGAVASVILHTFFLGVSFKIMIYGIPHHL
jgi:hypothetical protein